MAKKKVARVDAGVTARRVARNVIGSPPAEKVIVPKTEKKKVKHKKEKEREDMEG